MNGSLKPDVLDEPRCKKVLALLTPEPEWAEGICALLEAAFGPIDYRSPFTPFDGTTYYEEEMGAPLFRALASFRGLGRSEQLPDWKWASRDLERKLSREDGRRTLNLDIGYLDPDKLVLASFKRGPWKIYLGRGVWADMTLGYAKGIFHPTSWAFADFRDGRYNKALTAIREKMKAEMRKCSE